MMECTTLDGYPIFVDLQSIELIEQQEEGTLICTHTGNFIFVAESAADIYFERKKHEQEQMQYNLMLQGLTQ